MHPLLFFCSFPVSLSPLSQLCYLSLFNFLFQGLLWLKTKLKHTLYNKVHNLLPGSRVSERTSAPLLVQNSFGIMNVYLLCSISSSFEAICLLVSSPMNLQKLAIILILLQLCSAIFLLNRKSFQQEMKSYRPREQISTIVQILVVGVLGKQPWIWILFAMSLSTPRQVMNYSYKLYLHRYVL